MSLEEIKEREAHFKEFGDILVKRHGQNYYSSFDNDRRVTVDKTAVRFGRYLSAARSNAGLSIEDVAAGTRLSRATLVALEQGLILACEINPKWLKELAEVLGENTEEFNLILGRQISSGHPRWLTKRLVLQARNWLVHSKISLSSRPVYAACSAMLICLVIGVVSFWGVSYTNSPQVHQQTYSFIDVKPQHRLNMVRAELSLESQVILLSGNLDATTCCTIY